MNIDNVLDVYFVITGKSKNVKEVTKKEFAAARTYLLNHLTEEHLHQIKASDGYQLIATRKLTKQDVFLFDHFEGDFFQQLQQTKALIIGSRCFTTCLKKCQPIPQGSSPVYTTAMRDLRISVSGLTLAEKDRLRILIQWMGGHYFVNFDSTITHLVSNTIKSTKYEVATLNSIPVMHVDWVQRVWDRSCVDDVSAVDKEFEKYALPIFFGTNITCTGLDNKKKNEVMRLVNENGGVYHKAFRSSTVDIVITEANKTNSDKYAAAVKCKKDILLPEWIFDSVDKGFALPTKSYQVKSMKVSTPTKTDQTLADFTQADISRISTVGTRACNDGRTINETVSSGLNDTRDSLSAGKTSTLAPSSSNLQRQLLKRYASGNNYRLVYDEICPKKAKSAGNFLDGCCIYLSGFRNDEREKLNRILNAGGATRYDVLNDKITHIIVGQLDDAEFAMWKKNGLLSAVNIVRLDWLWESIKLKQPASENVYRISLPPTSEPDAPSPTSKRTLRSMNHSFKQPEIPIKKKLFDDGKKDTGKPEENFPSIEMARDDDEQQLIAQYSQENTGLPLPPLPDATQNDNSTTLLQPQPIASSTMANPLSQTTTTGPGGAPIDKPSSQLSQLSLNTIEIDYKNLNFFNGVALFIDKNHFPEEFYSQMIEECEAAHGNVVAANFRDPVDYVIVSFERMLDPARLPVKARHIITDLYVEECIKANKLVPIQYYHKHIPHTASAMPLTGMIIVISTYTGLEQDFIDSIAQLLGARTNVTYVKKERPLLVCPKSEGSKYEAAIKWGYPVVTSQWLVHCAEQGKKLPYDDYLVGRSKNSFPISPALRDQNSTAATPSRTLVPEVPMSVERGGMAGEPTITNGATPTASKDDEVTPLRNKRVSELASLARLTRASPSASKSPDSPHTPANKATYSPSYSFDIMEQVLANIENESDRELLREIITEMRNSQTPELERIRRQACTPINNKLPTPKGISEFCTTPEYKKRMADEIERRLRLPTIKMKPNTPIEELRRRILLATCQSMGVPIDDIADDQNADNTPTTSNAAKLASRPNQTLHGRTPLGEVTKQLRRTPSLTTGLVPRSIFAEQVSPTTTMRISRDSDTFVPSTQTQNSSEPEIEEMISKEQRLSILGKSSINFDKISFEDTEVASKSTNQLAEAVVKSSPEMKQITDYLKNCESTRRVSLKRSVTHDREKTSTITSTESPDLESQAHVVQPFESEQFGPFTEEMVGWRDPAEFSIERRVKTSSSMRFKGIPLFLISCNDNNMRDNVVRQIRLLGGEVGDVSSHSFDSACTHYVCERPNRGEKILGCIASGKWVLSLKYIEESFAMDTFIDEELYEWGNTKALNLPELSNEEQLIAQAAHRWRKVLSEDDSIKGVFTGFRAVLRLSERNCEALKNVLKAGDAIVIDAKPPYTLESGAQNATHCFVDLKKAPLTQTDYKFLKDHDVKVLSQMYINAYLMNGDNDADFQKHEITF